MSRDDKYISIEEASIILKVSTITIRGWIRKSIIPSWRIGIKLIRLSYSDVMALKKAKLEAEDGFGNLEHQRYAYLARRLKFPSQQ